MGNDVYIGMAVTAYDNGQLSTAVFTDVTIMGDSSPTATLTTTIVSSATTTETAVLPKSSSIITVCDVGQPSEATRATS